MNKAIVTLLLTFTASALICVTSARNTVCISANGEVVQVFCDDRDITKSLKNRMNPKKCDCIPMDLDTVSCKKVTIRAKAIKDGGQSQSGIEYCETAKPIPYKDWVCTPSLGNKGWKSQSMITNHWQMPRKSPRAKHCGRIKKLPCRKPMFWYDGKSAPSVDCVLLQCADECMSCAQIGAGKCDPGQCRYGEGVNYLTQKTRCNRNCRVDWLAWRQRDSPTATGRGYIRVTDLTSKSKDTIHANEPGYYLAIVDMDQCVFINKNYATWKMREWDQLGARNSDSLLSRWSGDVTMKNIVAVELAVGGLPIFQIAGTPYGLSIAPQASAFILGYNKVTPLIDNHHNCTASAVFTGFQSGNITTNAATWSGAKC